MSNFHPTGRAGRRLGLVFVLAFAAACSDGTAPDTGSPDFARGGQQGPDLHAAMAAQARHQAQIMARAGVEGIGVGLTDDGKAGAVVIMTANAAVGGLPRTLDGVPVKLMPTGPFSALPPSKVRPQPGNGHGGGHGGGGGGGDGLSPTDEWPRPVPIGVSIGNIDDPIYCSAGTLGARVKKGGNYYILSNNHVLARENDASIGERIMQPGNFDTANCASPDNLVIGNLAQFVQIKFGGNNTVDAAIASTTTANVGNGTYTGGYGVPNSITKNATVGMPVQKCGRTTGCTHGTVSAVNATISVQYEAGIASFTGQVVVTGAKHSKFSDSGDSGSLIVTDDANANPVALLFAGSSRSTIGNPIGAVLSALGVTIDGK
ncbi:MAG TPA: hypothetical protein VFK36_14105 [Gemmatimonadales bacterium]|nr:hypothetical protein [Gemmatimonadales bacterium]